MAAELRDNNSANISFVNDRATAKAGLDASTPTARTTHGSRPTYITALTLQLLSPNLRNPVVIRTVSTPCVCVMVAFTVTVAKVEKRTAAVRNTYCTTRMRCNESTIATRLTCYAEFPRRPTCLISRGKHMKLGPKSVSARKTAKLCDFISEVDLTQDTFAERRGLV